MRNCISIYAIALIVFITIAIQIKYMSNINLYLHIIFNRYNINISY